MMASGSESDFVKNAPLFWEQISSILPVGIMVTDLEGKVIYCNDVFDKWMPKFPLSGKLWFLQMQSHLEKNADQVIDLSDISINWIIQNLVYKDMEINTVWQGKKQSFRIRMSPLFNAENKISGVLEVTENITELKETHQSLQHSRRFETVGRLASGIAHDFNNILQVINGHSEMLMELRKDDKNLFRSLDIILTSGQKAAALTRQLLLFSRRQQGEFKTVNLGEMITNMQKILARMLGEDIAINMDLTDADVCIEGDESQLEQILMNLSINARDAMFEGGRITIKTCISEIGEQMKSQFPYMQLGTYVTLIFSDSGCGMPPDVRDHIFEPFFSTKELGRGTGLGLTSVYSIMKQHRGYIHVESELHKGTTFKLYFPVSASTSQGTESVCETVPAQGTKKKVLIVEDNEGVRELVVQVLSQFDYQVCWASSLQQANAIVADGVFDLFFVDIVLPDGSGASFVESMAIAQPTASFVLTSGYTEDKFQIKETLQKGFSFLHKPFKINSLLQACSDALQKIPR